MKPTRAVVALLTVGVLAAGAGRPVPLQVSGKSIYEGKGNCGTCHGRVGEGTPLAPALNDGAWLHIGGTVDEIGAVVRAGVAKPKQHPAPMPPMGGAKLSAAEIQAVARYVHDLSHPPPPPRQ